MCAYLLSKEVDEGEASFVAIDPPARREVKLPRRLPHAQVILWRSTNLLAGRRFQ